MPSEEYHDLLNVQYSKITGREKELEVLVSALLAGQHVLLEGAPGTSKSTLLRHVTETLKLPLYQVEGSADLTPSKLIGTFNPALVLEKGFQKEFFESGPLSKAMEEGGILYIDEFNRASPDATNALIRAMEEGELIIPRYGTVVGKPSFRIVAAMNPYDDTGVTRLSRALFDRLCRIRMDYQPIDEEVAIIDTLEPEAPNSLKELGVRIARATRYDDRLRQGASIRGAIDFVQITPQLAKIRRNYSVNTLLDAALAAFSGKIWIENPTHLPEEIISDILEAVLRDIGNSLIEELDIELKKKDPKT